MLKSAGWSEYFHLPFIPRRSPRWDTPTLHSAPCMHPWYREMCNICFSCTYLLPLSSDLLLDFWFAVSSGNIQLLCTTNNILARFYSFAIPQAILKPAELHHGPFEDYFLNRRSDELGWTAEPDRMVQPLFHGWDSLNKSLHWTFFFFFKCNENSVLTSIFTYQISSKE